MRFTDTGKAIRAVAKEKLGRASLPASTSRTSMR